MGWPLGYQPWAFIGRDTISAAPQQPPPSSLVLAPAKAAVRVAFGSGRAQQLRPPAPVSQPGFLGGRASGLPCSWYILVVTLLVSAAIMAVTCVFTPRDFRLLRVETALSLLDSQCPAVFGAGWVLTEGFPDGK